MPGANPGKSEIRPNDSIQIPLQSLKRSIVGPDKKIAATEHRGGFIFREPCPSKSHASRKIFL
jgi:hypothetical protein